MQAPDLKGVRNASDNLRDVSFVTPLNLNERLSEKLNCRIFFKREDLQKVRSFKISGAFNKIKSLNLENTQDGKKIIFLHNDTCNDSFMVVWTFVDS